MDFANRKLRASLLLGAATALALGMGGAASAAESESNIETVVVTGSRIPQANLASVSPIQSVSSSEFQLKGSSDVSDMLNDLPQTFISNTSDFTNTNNPLSTPGGITTIDLRGLGATRTLVLVNGRRLGVGDPNTGNSGAAPDIDQIPVNLLDRVEVLTGGASSTYGSDAIAGVVNFIMKQDFEGVQVDLNYGINWHDNGNKFARGVIDDGMAGGLVAPLKQADGSVFDGRNINASLIVGMNSADGKGNVTGYVAYRNADPVWQKNRDFSACQINITTKATCSGSANSNYIEVAGTDDYTIVGNEMKPWPNSASTPAAYFNSNDFETLSRQDTRFNAGFSGHYDLKSWAKPYAEFQFMTDRSFQQIAPSGVFSSDNTFSADGSGLYTVNCDNPLFSAQERNAICTSQGLSGSDMTQIDIARRNVEGGGRTSKYDHMNFRGVVGVKGDFADVWHYDVYGSYYYVSVDQSNGNYVSIGKLNNSLDVITGPTYLSDGKTANPHAGQIECRSVYNGRDAACVPYNLWEEGGVTKDQTDYLSTYGTSRGTLQEEILELDVNGDLGHYGIQSPFAQEGVKIALGATNRKDEMYFAGDVAEASNDLSGFGGAATAIDNKAINIAEEYGEVRVPLVQEKPYVKDLTLEAGIRFSQYSTHSRPTTWKTGLQWAPFDDIRFRGSYDVAIRAPSILETFTPQSVTNTSDVSVDPCAPVVDDNGVLHPATATLQQCERTGVTAAQYGNGGTTNTISQCPSNQCAVELGSGDVLKPEKAKTFSLGFTFTPSFIDGFVGSFDYYKIDVYNAIGSFPIDVALNQCLTNGTDCNLIKRNPTTGMLHGSTVSGGGYFVGTNMNTGYFNNSGFDIQATYKTGLDAFGLNGFGSLNLNLTGTYTLTAKSQPTSSEAVYDCVGYFGNTCGSPLPSWRHHFRATWETPWDVSLAMTWRYIGGSSLDKTSSQSSLAGNPGTYRTKIQPYNYFDLALTWDVVKGMEMRAGMNNIFDLDPPIISNKITGSGTPNTYNNYDMLGRTIFLSLTAKM